MCGLVGLAGDTSLKMRDVFTDLLYVDTLRGNHSTGAALIKRDVDEIILEKAALPGPEFIGTKEFKKLMENYACKAMIGHNRYATIGAKTADNAHPFQFDSVVGAHNGTIDKFALNEIEDHTKFGTDSEAVYNSINKFGLKYTIEKLTGAWALTFYDKLNNTMNLLRNNKRPLYYAYSDDMDTLMWASEAEMLAWVVGRHQIKLHDNRIYECEPDMHYRWALPTKFGQKMGKPIVSKIEGYKFTYKSPTYVHYSGNWRQEQNYNFSGVDNDKTWDSSQKKFVDNSQQNSNPKRAEKHTPKATYKKKVDTKKFRPPYKDAYGRVINKINLEKLTCEGCVYCDVADQKWGEFIHPLKDDVDGRKLYLCEECYNDDDIRELIEATL